jgi:hypothetical protein
MGGSSSGGLAMLSGLFSGMAQSMQAQAQYDQQMATIEAGKRAKDDEYKFKVANAILQQQQAVASINQANDAAAMQKSEIAREMLRAREAAKASAAAAGVAGNTVNRLVADLSFTEQQKLSAVELSRSNHASEQLMQQQNAIQGSKVSPFRYYVGDRPSFFNSIAGLIPLAMSGFGAWGAAGCSPTAGTQIAQTQWRFAGSPVYSGGLDEFYRTGGF